MRCNEILTGDTETETLALCLWNWDLGDKKDAATFYHHSKSEDGANGAEPEQGESETQTLFELLIKPFLKPSSLTFQLLMSTLLLCAKVRLIWIFFSSSVTESNDTGILLLLLLIFTLRPVSPSAQWKWKSDRIWIQLWHAGILRSLRAWQGLELPEVGMGFPYLGHRKDGKQWEGYW